MNIAQTLVVVIGSLIFALMIACVFLLRKTDLLRDSTSQIADAANKPYSFARTQIAWWTVIVIGSFIYIFAYNFCANPTESFTINNYLNSSVLILMGISAGVMGIGCVSDNADMKATPNRHQDLPSDGFFTDILSDNDGISIHRFQYLLFNIVYGLIFILYVFSNQKMMQFGELELGLMGISAASYTGLKTMENNPNKPTK